MVENKQTLGCNRCRKTHDIMKSLEHEILQQNWRQDVKNL